MTDQQFIEKAVRDYKLGSQQYTRACKLLGPDLLVFVDEPSREASWKSRPVMVEGWRKFPHNESLRVLAERCGEPAAQAPIRAFWIVLNLGPGKPFLVTRIEPLFD